MYAMPNLGATSIFTVTFGKPNNVCYATRMNWKQIISDLRSRLTFQAIGDSVGMTKGQVHDLGKGNAKSVMYETGVALVKLHRRIQRRKQ
jgi:hypothetical protein